jgi:polyferredoxin
VSPRWRRAGLATAGTLAAAVLVARQAAAGRWVPSNGATARPPRGRDLLALRLVGRILRFRPFQFLCVLPIAGALGLVLISTAGGLDHPSFNFGTQMTWVVWWGGLLLTLVVLGRVWCLVCPVGAVGDWVQRLCLWGRTRYAVGFGLRWPRPLRNLWPATVLFGAFVWLDQGYGLSNSPRLTAGLIVVLLLASAWIGLLFERRTFCRYLCPLTPFLGLGALGAMFELRARDPGVCRARCTHKDCYRGNARHHGCPAGEFPGGGMDTNLSCVLCTECVRSCPHDNIAMRFRPPGRDLWSLRHRRRDGAAAAAILAGLATLVPWLLVVVLPPWRSLVSRVLAGEGARMAAVTALFLVGSAASLGLVRAFGHLVPWVSGVRELSPRAAFAAYAYALVPVGLARFLADLGEQVLRAPGGLADATRALLLDLPWNRTAPTPATVAPLLGPEGTYAVQVGLLLAGLLLTLEAMRRVTCRLFARPQVAGPAFVPMAALAVLLTLASVWTLGRPLL